MNIHPESTIRIELPLAFISDSLEDIETFVKRNYGVYQIDHHEMCPLNCTDMIVGWKVINNVKDYSYTTDGPFEPGVYALVFDKNNTSSNPIFDSNTILFGESTRDTWKRLVHHTGALKGKTSNMTNKWDKHLPKINQILDTDITQHLDKIKIYFRPHQEDVGKWKTDRKYSTWMETSCHAIYHLFHGRFTPGNTRDLPSDRDIEQYKTFLTEAEYLK